jgi:hypothetical protein
VKQSGLEVQALRNEAEALWGKGISEKLGTLLHQSAIVQTGIRVIVSDKQAHGAHFKKNADFGEKMNARVFDYGDTINDDGTEGGPNEFTVKIEQAVEYVATYLRNKLPQSSRRTESRD